MARFMCETCPMSKKCEDKDQYITNCLVRKEEFEKIDRFIEDELLTDPSCYTDKQKCQLAKTLLYQRYLLKEAVKQFVRDLKKEIKKVWNNDGK